ncbi:MAG: hypothetical protein ABL903_10805 [Methylococcales bacterium]
MRIKSGQPENLPTNAYQSKHITDAPPVVGTSYIAIYGRFSGLTRANWGHLYKMTTLSPFFDATICHIYKANIKAHTPTERK